MQWIAVTQHVQSHCILTNVAFALAKIRIEPCKLQRLIEDATLREFAFMFCKNNNNNLKLKAMDRTIHSQQSISMVTSSGPDEQL